MWCIICLSYAIAFLLLIKVCISPKHLQVRFSPSIILILYEPKEYYIQFVYCCKKSFFCTTKYINYYYYRSWNFKTLVKVNYYWILLSSCWFDFYNHFVCTTLTSQWLNNFVRLTEAKNNPEYIKEIMILYNSICSTRKRNVRCVI